MEIEGVQDGTKDGCPVGLLDNDGNMDGDVIVVLG